MEMKQTVYIYNRVKEAQCPLLFESGLYVSSSSSYHIGVNLCQRGEDPSMFSVDS